MEENLNGRIVVDTVFQVQFKLRPELFESK